MTKKLSIVLIALHFTAFIFASTAGENPFNKDHAVIFCKNSVSLGIPQQSTGDAPHDAVLVYINNTIHGSDAPEIATYFKTNSENVIKYFKNFIDLRERVEGKPFHVFHSVHFMPTWHEENSSGAFVIAYTTESFRQLELERLSTMKQCENCINGVSLYNTNQHEYHSLARYFGTSLENVEEYVKGLRNAYIL